jgi:hypothetical protein
MNRPPLIGNRVEKGPAAVHRRPLKYSWKPNARAYFFFGKVVSLNFASWNQLERWFRDIDALRRAA